MALSWFGRSVRESFPYQTLCMLFQVLHKVDDLLDHTLTCTGGTGIFATYDGGKVCLPYWGGGGGGGG